MLYFERGGTLDPQHEGRRLRPLLPDRPRPADLEGFAVGGDLGADNVGPTRNDLGRGEPLRFEDVGQRGAEQLGKRAGKTARRAAHRVKPCAKLGVMTLAVRSPRRKKAA